jgi:hypothetical protein
MLDWLTQCSDKAGIRWICVPFDYVTEPFDPRHVQIAQNIASHFPRCFLNFMVAGDGRINLKAAEGAASLVRAVGRLSANGFDNFRVGVSCNVLPNTPFFPFSYHRSDTGFSLALETAELMLEVAENARDLNFSETQSALFEALCGLLEEVEELGAEIEARTGVRYIGVDASLAPLPDGTTSVGRMMEMLGLDDFGSSGTLFYTSALTNIIKTALTKTGVKRVGFNGVMLSLLEDDYLARRAKQKNFTIDGLIGYSAVCGCGLDMVPIPGDVLGDEILAIISDVSALSLTLNKPLGVRLLPIPGKSANELTDFNHDFLVDTRIMPVRDRSFDLNIPGDFRYLGLTSS